MSKEQRVNEILSQITTFGKEYYSKEEFLPELLKLQQELVCLTYNCDHAENGNLRLWDVEKHLQEKSDERNHIADAELEKFIQGSKVVCNTIKSEFSGNIGEQKVFQVLDNLECTNAVLHNVELEFNGKRTEIDAIVFTKQAVFIIEVKNTKKNIFIDENGGFFRIGNSMHYDCNIAEKMDEREELLRMALERAGMENMKIFKIITFTNKYIDVECKYRYIKVCPVNYLAHFIENFKTNIWCSEENISTMVTAVEEVECKEAYKMTIDMNEYKTCFATLMAELEFAEDVQVNENANCIDNAQIEEDETGYTVDSVLTELIDSQNERELMYKKLVANHNVKVGVQIAAISLAAINIAMLTYFKLIRK